MKKKSLFSRFLSCAIAATTLLMAAPVATTVNAATTWNNTSNVSWIDSSKKIIAFAFDDGPVRSGNSATSILNTLEKYKMHATFFYVGNQITNYSRDEIKRAYNLGCEVANHTYSHTYLTNLSASGIQNEVNRTANILKEITGQSNFLIRPPYLATNANVFNTINVPLITCNLDTQDWNGASKDAIINKVLSNAKDGDILLMHETYNTTADAVATLVPELIKRGFVITSVSELFKMKGKTMTSGKVYSSCPGPNVVNNNTGNTGSNTGNTNTNTGNTGDTGSNTETDATGNLALDYSISNWGSAYQVNFKVINKSDATVNSWSLKLKKSQIKITTSWNVNIKSEGDYYVITPMSFNSNLDKGASIEFGVQGTGSIGTTLDYTLS